MLRAHRPVARSRFARPDLPVAQRHRLASARAILRGVPSAADDRDIARNAFETRTFAAIVDPMLRDFLALRAVEGGGDGGAGEVLSHAASILTTRRIFTTPSSILRVVPSP